MNCIEICVYSPEQARIYQSQFVKGISMRNLFRLSALLITLLLPHTANAFCGFYVARADGELFNEASKVVFVRDGRKSVITMSSDYRGPVKDFAMIVPTPKVLRRNQVRTVSPKTIDHLDAYSAPRLVEYFDDNPCNPPILYEMAPRGGTGGAVRKAAPARGPKAFGVTIRAHYAVGVYDILMLSAKQSDGLVTWLKQEGYNIPDGAEAVLQRYIKGGMKFFVARVNLKRHANSKTQELQPLQISFRSGKFMLPIQLGKINGKGKQDLLLMTLTRTGAVVTANYRTRKIPSDVEIPVFVKDMFPAFYKATFSRAAERSGVLMEYAWDMAWCDPCAADPLAVKELKELGVTWLKQGANAGQDVFITRLHLRYDSNSFRKDLLLKHTKDRSNFQGRYVIRHPYVGRMNCAARTDYVRDVRRRLREEAVTLGKLTGWSPRKIEKRIRQSVPKSYW